MTEFVQVRASETLGQGDLISLLKTRFPRLVKSVGPDVLPGTACVEVQLPTASPAFAEVRRFIEDRRAHGDPRFDYVVNQYVREYTKAELASAEILRVTIEPRFEPAGEECGTVYETLCEYCNLGHQRSDLVLSLRRVPKRKDIASTIAWVEWVVSSGLVQTFRERGLTGAEFLPVFDYRDPTTPSPGWRQLLVIGEAGLLSPTTKFGRDPFSPADISWQCPRGHSIDGVFLSEIHLKRSAWDSSDIAVTRSLFGQGRNLLRPSPEIIISQRAFRALQAAGMQGLRYEVARLEED